MWKLKSILSGILLGATLFIIFPEIGIYINEFFQLPIFRNIIYQIAGLSSCFISLSLFVCSSHLFSKIGKGTPAPYWTSKGTSGGRYISFYTKSNLYWIYLSDSWWVPYFRAFLTFALCVRCHIFCTFLCRMCRRT